MAKTILVKPLITEKAEMLSEEGGKYSFVVAKGANKIEIKKAVEAMSFQVVNTHHPELRRRLSLLVMLHVIIVLVSG